MDINGLKSNIENILDEIEKGQYSIPIANEIKSIQVVLLMIDNRIVKASLPDMRKAVAELESEEKIMIFPPDVLLLKLLERLGVKNVNGEDVIFAHSLIKKANEGLLKDYRKWKDWIKQINRKIN